VGADLELVAGGRSLRFPAVWLRDNCPCPECLVPGTGQKLIDITGIPNGLAITRTEDAGQSVRVTFGPDQHRSVFSRAWLAAHALDGHGSADGDGRTEDDKELWLAADLTEVPAVRWPRYLAGEEARALAAVLRLGFVLLRDVPAEPGTVLEVAASFGYVRETNYGRLFDVRVEPAPGNLAYTSRAIRPHTDNPYRDPAPTVQLLHCLRAAGQGSAASGSTTGRCGRCGGRTPRSPRSTPPTGRGRSCSRGRNGSSACGWRRGTAWSSTTRGCCTPGPPSA
jgi:gamma-butyrobetaine dioxygenase